MTVASPTKIRFAVALIAGLFLFAAPYIAVAGEGPPPSLPPSSMGCFSPCDAANGYLYEIFASGFSDPNDFSSDPRICAKQCKALASTGCKKVWKAAAKCWQGIIVKGEGKFAKAGCKEEADPSTCKDGVQTDVGAFKTALKADIECAKYWCEWGLQYCDGCICGDVDDPNSLTCGPG